VVPLAIDASFADGTDGSVRHEMFEMVASIHIDPVWVAGGHDGEGISGGPG
jgi:hypothetical protein